MKLFFTQIILLLISLQLSGQVKSTSYVNKNGEEVLKHELIIPVDINQAWLWLTTDSLLTKWVAPKVHMELKMGGYRISSYDSNSTFATNSIKLPVISYLENELLILKVNLNENFPLKTRQKDHQLHFIFQLRKIDKNHTRIIGSMLGWGTGAEWKKVYDFFYKGNHWTFEQLRKCFH